METVTISDGERTAAVPADRFSRLANSLLLLPKKYESGGPYVYVATRDSCDCPIAIHPHGFDPKAAGRVLAEWGKVGWFVRTVGKREIRVRVCGHEIGKEAELLVYVAEKFCGCCVGVQPPIPDGEAGVAKVLQVWVENGYYIQSIPLADVFIQAECPHFPPKERQGYLHGLASADNGNPDDEEE
ncbi:MAG: hypothetical protein L0332_30410 [Chloroflexi bacterium]|nr:hypothetical protein [Chloroflexota bacterium]